MNAKAANPGANASACAPRRASRAGAGRTHSHRTSFVCCILVAILLGGGIALHTRHARHAAARNRELSERLLGPLLSGVPDTDEPLLTVSILDEDFRIPGVPAPGKPLWTVELLSKDLDPLFIPGVARATLGADLVHKIAPPTPDDSFRITWLVGAGTPTESRLFERLRTDPDARAAWENPERSVSDRAFLLVDGTATNLLSDSVREKGKRVGYLKADGAGLRERLLSALDAESARADVSFAEERLTAGVIIVLVNWPTFEEPGRFRQAVGWCCERLDFLPLDLLSDWASEDRPRRPDPAFPWRSQILSLNIQEGQPAPCRMHQSGNGTVRRLELSVDASTPLAASLQALLAKHRPETLGDWRDPGEFVEQGAEIMVLFPDRIETRIVPLADIRLRAFLLDLLRLLAAPPPDTPSTAPTNP